MNGKAYIRSFLAGMIAVVLFISSPIAATSLVFAEESSAVSDVAGESVESEDLASEEQAESNAESNAESKADSQESAPQEELTQEESTQEEAPLEEELQEEIQEETQEEALQEEAPQGEASQEEQPQEQQEAVSAAESAYEEAPQFVSSTAEEAPAPESLPPTSDAAASQAESASSSAESAVESIATVVELVGAPLALNMKYDQSSAPTAVLTSDPHIYLLLKKKETPTPTPSPSPNPIEQIEYVIKLTYDKTQQQLQAELADIVVGDYDVFYYTAAYGKSQACDQAAGTNPREGKITNDFVPITVGTAFLGGALVLMDAPQQITVNGGPTSTLGTLSYVGKPVPVSVHKNISGTASETAHFYFNLYSSDSSYATNTFVATGQTTGTITNTAGQQVKLADLIFLDIGDYYFSIQEDSTKETVDYYTYDTAVRKLHYSIGAGTNGSLVIQNEERAGEQSLLVNSDAASPGSLTFNGHNMKVKDAAEAAKYSYSLYGPYDSEAEALPADASYKQEKLLKGPVSLTQSGTDFSYSLKADQPLVEGKFYALTQSYNGVISRDYIAVIAPHVSTAGVSWDLKQSGAVVTNTYLFKPATQTITIKKKVNGTSKTSHTFTFVLKNKNKSTVGSTSVKGAGTKTMTLRFSSPGTYTYYLSESKGTVSGYTYDTKEHKIVFTVTDGGKGNLNFKDTVDDAQVSAPTVTFTNSYSVPIKFYLINSSKKYLTDGRLRVTNSAGKTVGKAWTTTNKYHEIDFTADGKYTLTEVTAPEDYVKASPITFTIENGKIKGSSSGSTRTVIMTNTLATGPFSFTKVSAESGKGVGGATYALYRIKASKGTSAYKTAASHLSSGKIVWSELGGVATQTSGSGGGVGFDSLNPNTYYVIRETKAAPGYQKSADSAIIKTNYSGSWSVDVIYGASGTLAKSGSSYVWKEYPTKVVVNVRSSSGAYLKGAKLTITDTTTNKVIEAWQSGSTGHEVKATMVIGRKYKIEQTNKLKGYTNSNPVTFTVAAKDTTGSSPVQYVTFVDTKDSTPTPTGGGGGTGGGGRSGGRTASDADSTDSDTDSRTRSGESRTTSITSGASSTVSGSSTNATGKAGSSAKTGDNAPIAQFIILMACALAVILFLVLRRKN